MGNLTFWLTGHPPHDNTTRRWHWAKRSREMKMWRDAANWATRAAYRDSTLTGAFRPCRIHVVFKYKVRRTRDVANLVASLKPVIDGIVDARMLRDDSPEWLPEPPTVVEMVDPQGFDGIIVTLTEIEP